MSIVVMNADMHCFENKAALEFKQDTLQLNLKKKSNSNLCMQNNSEYW